MVKAEETNNINSHFSTDFPSIQIFFQVYVKLNMNRNTKLNEKKIINYIIVRKLVKTPLKKHEYERCTWAGSNHHAKAIDYKVLSLQLREP